MRAIRTFLSIVAAIPVLGFAGYFVYLEYFQEKTYTEKGTEVGDDVTKARVGDCAEGRPSEDTPAVGISQPLYVVKCGDPKSRFKIVGIIPNSPKPKGVRSSAACKRFRGADTVYYKVTEDERYDDNARVTVVCLNESNPNKK